MQDTWLMNKDRAIRSAGHESGMVAMTMIFIVDIWCSIDPPQVLLSKREFKPITHRSLLLLSPYSCVGLGRVLSSNFEAL